MNAYIKTNFFRQSLVIFAGIPLLIWAQTDLPVRSMFKESLSVLTILAWCLMLIVGITCLTRKKLPIRYTTWRSLHGILAVALVSIIPLHVMDLGRHSSIAMLIFIILSAAGIILLFGKRYIVQTSKETGKMK